MGGKKEVYVIDRSIYSARNHFYDGVGYVVYKVRKKGDRKNILGYFHFIEEAEDCLKKLNNGQKEPA
jgi:hypothetical protein